MSTALPELAATLGWLGASFVLLGYSLMVSGRLAADSARYLALNAAGTAGLLASTMSAHAWQSVVVNVLWLGFGVPPLRRALRRRRERLAARRPRRVAEFC